MVIGNGIVDGESDEEEYGEENVRVEVDGQGGEDAEIQQPSTPVVTDPKADKAAKKQMEKEERKRKEEEKRQLKEHEKQLKQLQKSEKNEGVPRKQERDEKKKGLGGFMSPIRLGVRPRNAVRGRVLLLDGSEIEVEIDKDAKVQVLVKKVCEYVNIVEEDYFSVMYNDRKEGKFWLIHDRRIVRQIGNGDWLFEFCVKYYPPEPSVLVEDITRYQLCLQVRDDIMSGKVPCSPVACALLGACTVQSELGDYDVAEFGTGIDYIQDIPFAPGQTDELLTKIAEMHRTQMRGRNPAEAELMYLENAKKLDMYGIHLQPAKDIELFDIWVGVSATGIHVYRDRLRVNRFPWPKVLKMSYKNRTFYIKIRPGEFERFQNTVGFKMDTHNMAKRFWRLCIDHHTFFRLKEPIRVDRGVFARFGSSKMRFSGRTLHQSRDWSRSIDRAAPFFERSLSQRSLMSRSLNASSFLDRDDKRRSASMERSRRPANYDDEYADEHQVAVVAGTAVDAGRVAYVKTVRPMSPAVEQQPEPVPTSAQGHYTNEMFRYEVDDLSPLSTDVSRNMTGEDGEPKKRKKKKKKPSQRISAGDGGMSTVTEVTEYKTEANGVIETRTERRLVVTHEDIDHDLALSRAITNVTDMNTNLSVEKIEINPVDVAKSMVETGSQEKIEIAPARTKKVKKKSTKREKVAELA